jgi:hypothetical protein
MRDLIRARATAVRVLGKARQNLQGFLLRHGRIYPGKKGWNGAYRRWLARVRFDHPAQQIVLQDYIHAVEDAEARVERLASQIEDLLPNWSMRPVVEAVQAIGRHHQGGQCARAPRSDRGSMDVSHAGARQPEAARAAGGSAQGSARHRLEGSSAALQPISAAGRIRQGEGRGHDGDRTRDCRLHLGHCASRSGGFDHCVIADLTRCLPLEAVQGWGTLATCYEPALPMLVV